jgi:hypothetical protein
MAGRPSTYTPEIAERICRELAEGKSLRKICEADDMPAQGTVYVWIETDRDGFQEKYTRAREFQADTFVDEIVDISDEEPDSQRARVRIDARKWSAGKMRPKKYGEKVDLNHTGEVATVSRIEHVIVGANGANAPDQDG